MHWICIAKLDNLHFPFCSFNFRLFVAVTKVREIAFIATVHSLIDVLFKYHGI